jgi:dienelactone hydrolase
MHRYRGLILGLLAIFLLTPARAQEARSFTLETGDGVTVYGEIHEPAHVKKPPLILAFHQGGGDSRGEYAPIIPRLLDEGFAVLTIDQRSGGDVFGGANRTVNGLPDGTEYGFCDALPDLEAALTHARDLGWKEVIAWGSSYSATPVLYLAASHPENIQRVVALSPAGGDPMVGCQPQEAASRLSIPALMVRPEREAAIDFVANDLEAFRQMGHDVYISPGGSHGSSILVPERTGAPTEAVWSRVLAFLRAEN